MNAKKRRKRRKLKPIGPPRPCPLMGNTLTVEMLREFVKKSKEQNPQPKVIRLTMSKYAYDTIFGVKDQTRKMTAEEIIDDTDGLS